MFLFKKKSLVNLLFFLFITKICFLFSSCGVKPIPTGSSIESNIIIPGIASPLIHSSDSTALSKTNHTALLDNGEESLLLRIHLIRAALHTISLQTLIWENDETGRLMMYEMIQAAKRGVKVQLLIDHYVSEKHPEIAAFLATAHPNLTIKIYNPVIGHFSQHKIYPTLLDQMTKLLFSFNKVNQRMHNKVFIVDNQIGITGGRNIQNAYFDQARGMNYRDRDVLITGPVVTDMQKSFDEFWAFKRSIHLKKLVNLSSAYKNGIIKTWSTKKDFAFNGLFEELFIDANNPRIIKDLFVKNLEPVEQASFLADIPGKNRSIFWAKYYGSGKITRDLAQLVSGARDNIFIDTPYLILSSPAIKLFKTLRHKRPAIDIKIATNSLAATDSWHCYALSFQQKQIMLQDLNFQLYEFKPMPGDMRIYMPGYDTLRRRPFTPAEKSNLKVTSLSQKKGDKEFQRPPVSGEPYLALHAKSLVIDDEIAFIGSYNLDPRSENLNTEVGLVVKDKIFAAKVKKSIALNMAPQNSWVIAKNRYPIRMETPNAILVELSRLIPIIDLWPIRYAGSYNLKENKRPLDPNHIKFYEHYEYVGNFPDVPPEKIGKVFNTVTTKTFLGIAKPLL